MIAILMHDHDRLREIANGLDRFLAYESAPCEAEFGRLRWQLMRELSRHLAAERLAIFGDGEPCGAALTDGLDIGLDAALGEHMSQWSGATIHANWDIYRESARSLLARLRQRMKHEEAAIFPSLRPDARTLAFS